MVDGDGKTSDSGEMEKKCIRVLCRKRITAAASSAERSVFWLVGSPRSLPPFTVISVVKCLHWDPSVGLDSIDFSREADDLRAFLLRGLDVVGALFVDCKGEEECAINAVDISAMIRHLLFDDKDSYDMIGAVSDVLTKDISFFVKDGKSRTLEAITSVVYENQAENYVGERVCLLKCASAFKLPIYIPLDKTSDALEMVSSVIDAAAAKFRHPKTCYMVEAMSMSIPGKVPPVILHGADLDLIVGSTFKCSDLSKSKPSFSKENADIIRVSLFSNQSEPINTSSAPLAEYFPAPITARYYLLNVKLDVLCYAARDFTLTSSISELVIPGLLDQLFILKKAITPNLFTQQRPQLFPYHFFPPGCLHPITAIYDLTYGEMEMKQVETRRCLHQRLGLPLDRPLLLTANALTFDSVRDSGRDLERGGKSCSNVLSSYLLCYK